MRKRIVTFDSSAKEEILDLFNMAVDPVTGYVTEKNNPEKIVLSPEGDPVELKNFGGIRKGSLAIIKSDINSLINLSDSLK